MGTSISRAQFLRGDFSGDRTAVRPPWAVPEACFVEQCTRCGDCISACPEHLLSKGRGGFPVIEFTSGECTFCAQCVERCAPAALQRVEGEAPWNLKAHISESCLTYRGIVCRSCGERCEERAIRFRPVVGGVSQPQLDIDACTGCGACFKPCPVGAVALREQATAPSHAALKEAQG